MEVAISRLLRAGDNFGFVITIDRVLKLILDGHPYTGPGCKSPDSLYAVIQLGHEVESISIANIPDAGGIS